MAKPSTTQTVKVLVETVVPLTETEKVSLENILVNQFVSFTVNERVNPLLIGGIKLSFGDKILDYSLKARLNNIQKGLLEHAQN
jgi:F0F1-type ATP synthase delta subunit